MFKDGKYTILQNHTDTTGTHLGSEAVGWFVIDNQKVTEKSPELHISLGPVTWQTEVAIDRLNNGYRRVEFTPENKGVESKPHHEHRSRLKAADFGAE